MATEYSLILVSLQYWTKYCPITFLEKMIILMDIEKFLLIMGWFHDLKGILTIPTTPASLEE